MPKILLYRCGLLALFILSLGLVACGELANLSVPANTNPAAALAMGDYTRQISINDIPLEILQDRPYLRSYVGPWELRLDKQGNFSVSNNDLLVAGSYSWTADEIIFYGGYWAENCGKAGADNEITYKWHIYDGKYLTLISLEDACFNRGLLLTSHSWALPN